VTALVRELITGTVAAAGLMILVFLWAMPWWLAMLLATGLYVGLRTTLPVAPAPHEALLEGGVTVAERRTLVADSQRHLSTIRALSERIAQVQPDFVVAVRHLCSLTEELLTLVVEKPQSLGLAGMLPMYLEKIAENLRLYVDLARQSRGDPLLQQRLAVTEEMVRSAIAAFERWRQRSYKDDWIALEAEAEALKTLFETDLH
jgi:hypothetical protein